MAIAFSDQRPVFANATVPLAARFMTVSANCALAPPCMNSTAWSSGTSSSARRSRSARPAMSANAALRWLVSSTEMPVPR